MSTTQARAVRFEEYGGREVLKVVQVPVPEPGPHEVVVEVRAAGIQPGEAKIRAGLLEAVWPATFPSGQGSDLAGVVHSLGSAVTAFAVGDEVLGFSDTRSSHATHVAVPISQLAPKPPALSWEVAGALKVAGTTAYVTVQAVAPQPGEVIAVSGAAGGVGTIAVQLLARRGVRVLGIASAANADWLSGHGVVPVAYGEGLAERLRAAAGEGGLAAFVDLYGPEYLDLAMELGVPKERVNTIVPGPQVQKLGVQFHGGAEASTPEVVLGLAQLAAVGAIEVPIAATYPLENVADAFAELEQGHTRGKIVLIP